MRFKVTETIIGFLIPTAEEYDVPDGVRSRLRFRHGSIALMEIVDNAFMPVIPGAINAGPGGGVLFSPWYAGR